MHYKEYLYKLPKRVAETAIGIHARLEESYFHFDSSCINGIYQFSMSGLEPRQLFWVGPHVDPKYDTNSSFKLYRYLLNKIRSVNLDINPNALEDSASICIADENETSERDPAPWDYHLDITIKNITPEISEKLMKIVEKNGKQLKDNFDIVIHVHRKKIHEIAEQRVEYDKDIIETEYNKNKEVSGLDMDTSNNKRRELVEQTQKLVLEHEKRGVIKEIISLPKDVSDLINKGTTWIDGKIREDDHMIKIIDKNVKKYNNLVKEIVDEQKKIKTIEMKIEKIKEDTQIKIEKIKKKRESSSIPSYVRGIHEHLKILQYEISFSLNDRPYEFKNTLPYESYKQEILS